jgi:hypothetical protein
MDTDIIEVRFKNTRRVSYRNVNGLRLEIGDIVAVEASRDMISEGYQWWDH